MHKWLIVFMLCLSGTPLLAQQYPVKPIELVVHTSAGSGGDLVSRAVADIIRRHKFLPQPILVNNRVGGTEIGRAHV